MLDAPRVIKPDPEVREKAMIEFIEGHFGKISLDHATFNELNQLGFCRARAEQTIEELYKKEIVKCKFCNTTEPMLVYLSPPPFPPV